MDKSTGPRQVVVHNAAALDQSDQRARAQEGQSLDYFPDDRPERRKTVCAGKVMISEDSGGHKRQSSQEEKAQQDKDRYRPAGSQALIAHECPSQAAIPRGFGCKNRLIGRRFQL
jgi:hypothetical protein